jgi:hypothetical protein
MELEEVLVEEQVCLLEFDGPVIQCVRSLWLSKIVGKAAEKVASLKANGIGAHPLLHVKPLKRV